jgi:hypothetical protein
MSMIYVSFKVACRNCYQTDGITRMYTILNASQEEYSKRTEYSVLTQVEQWRSRDGHTCPACGSENSEVMDIAINDRLLYVFNDLVTSYGASIFAMKIDKTNSEFDIQIGDGKKVEIFFLKKALQLLLFTIRQRPDNLFQRKSRGQFLICITSELSPEVQRLRHAGMTKIEIINKILEVAAQNGLKL